MTKGDEGMTTYFVHEVEGDDTNDGLTPETALKTRDEALRRCDTGQPLYFVPPPAESARVSFTTPQQISRADVERKRREGRR